MAYDAWKFNLSLTVKMQQLVAAPLISEQKGRVGAQFAPGGL